MSTENPDIYKLIIALESGFDDLLTVIKAMANDKRLSILIALLTGTKSFDI